MWRMTQRMLLSKNRPRKLFCFRRHFFMTNSISLWILLDFLSDFPQRNVKKEYNVSTSGSNVISGKTWVLFFVNKSIFKLIKKWENWKCFTKVVRVQELWCQNLNKIRIWFCNGCCECWYRSFFCLRALSGYKIKRNAVR